MSEYDKLIDTSTKGVFCVCFRNKARLSLKEITEIFSEFGELVGINCPGNEEGHRFIRYRTKEEALKCTKALDGHSDIKLQIIKQKNKGSNESSRSDKFTQNKWDNTSDQNQIKHDPEQTEKADSTKGSQSSRKSRNNTNNNQRKKKDDIVQNDNINNGNSKISKDNKNRHQPVTNDQNPMRKYSDSKTMGKCSTTKESDEQQNDTLDSNNLINAARLVQLHKLRGIIANTFQPSSNDSRSGMLAVVASTTVPSPPFAHHSLGMTDEPPPLIPASQFSQNNGPNEKIEVIRACDVVVANIHSNIGVADIYHIFRKYSPIHVSDIETVADINIRFCYAYFGMPEDASGVEQSFDGVSLCGQNLITLRSHRLEVEAATF